MYAPIIVEDLKRVLKSLHLDSSLENDIVLSIPENPDFGDYSTNIALQLAKQKSQNSYHSSAEIANAIIAKMGHPDYFERIEVAGPGFINFYLNPKHLTRLLTLDRLKKSTGEHILVEYAQPNTHKELHIGHFRNITIGESLARLLEDQGAKVFRANYGSDIGLPVAKALYGVLKSQEALEQARKASIKEKAEFLAKSYVVGNTAYEEDPEAKVAINDLNKQIYERKDEIMALWQETKDWSLADQDLFYTRVGTEFDRVIFESEVEGEGKRIVLEHTERHPELVSGSPLTEMLKQVQHDNRDIFKASEGAIIFPGEDYGLHTRVFITSVGNPTYEAKEIGLTLKEQELFPYDLSLHVIDTQQSDYFKVVNKALELLKIIKPDKKRHIAYGFVTLTSGRMSSRTGNMVKAADFIDDVKLALKEAFPSLDDKTTEQIAIGAIKFYFLKYSLASDIVFDVQKSISLQGDTGTYLQYTYARIHSVLSKISKNTIKDLGLKIYEPDPDERELMRRIEHFDLVLEKAVASFQPNELCTYLIELVRGYNNFYQTHPIIKSEHQDFRALLSKKVGETLKDGLYLLGIEAPERM